MNDKRLKKLAGLKEMVDQQAFRSSLLTIENALVALQDEAYSMEGEQRQMVLDAISNAYAIANNEPLISKTEIQRSFAMLLACHLYNFYDMFRA